MLGDIRRRGRSYRQMLALFGWGTVCRNLGLSVLQKVAVYRLARIYRLDIDADACSGDSGSGNVKYGFVDGDEVDRELLSQVGLTAESLERELKSGHRCFVGVSGASQCYFSIVSYDGFVIPRRYSARLSADEAYVGNCYTVVSHRGLGIYPRGLQALARELAGLSKRRLYLYVEFENEASIRGVEKAGFHAVAQVSVWGVGSMLRRGWRWLGSHGEQSCEPGEERWRVEVVR